MVAPVSLSSLVALLLSIGHLHRSFVAVPAPPLEEIEKVISLYSRSDVSSTSCQPCRDDFSLLGAGVLGGVLATLGFLVAGRCRSIITITNQVVSGGGFSPVDLQPARGSGDVRDVRTPATPKRLVALGYEPS
jgi:hypothetical protein